MTHYAIQLLDYNRWAMNRYFDHLKSLPDETCLLEVNSVFPTLFDVLVHVYVIDHGWLTSLKHEVIEDVAQSVDHLTKKAQGKSLPEMERLFNSLWDDYASFLLHHPDPDEKDVFYGPLLCSYGEVIQHVVNHASYHRGNMTAMLRQLGYTGTMTDFSLYLYHRNQKI